MRTKSSQYFGVVYNSPDDIHDRWRAAAEAKPWRTCVKTSGRVFQKSFATEREAAIHADRINLEHRLGKPLNILKPKV